MDVSQWMTKEVMTYHVVSISPQAALREAAQRLRKDRFGALPVVEEGKLWALSPVAICSMRCWRQRPSRGTELSWQGNRYYIPTRVLI